MTTQPTHYQIALQTIAGRDIRRRNYTKEEQIAKYEQDLAEFEACGWGNCEGAKYRRAALAVLKQEGSK